MRNTEDFGIDDLLLTIFDFSAAAANSAVMIRRSYLVFRIWYMNVASFCFGGQVVHKMIQKLSKSSQNREDRPKICQKNTKTVFSCSFTPGMARPRGFV